MPGGRRRRQTEPSVDENPEDPGNQPRGENAQGHQHKRKRRELQAELDATRDDLLEAEDEIRELRIRLNEQEAETEQLRAADAQAGAHGGHIGGDAQRAPNNGAGRKMPSDQDKKTVRAAGRRCCLLHLPWMQGESLFDKDVRNAIESIVQQIQATRAARNEDSSDSEESDPVDQFWRAPRFEIASPTEIAREVMSHLDIGLAKQWFEPWFKVEFKTGMRKMRSEVVGEIADRRHTVFGLTDEEFGERHGARNRGAGANTLLEGDEYLWAKDDPQDPKTRVERFMRSDILLNATKLILLGSSSIESEKRSVQAGPSRAEMWHIRSITPSILSLVAIAVRFVLSGDGSFDKVTSTANYMDCYEANLRLLKAHRSRHRQNFDDMTTLYNLAIAPDIYSNQEEEAGEFVGMTAAQKEFYLTMVEPSATGEEEAGEGAGTA